MRKKPMARGSMTFFRVGKPQELEGAWYKVRMEESRQDETMEDPKGHARDFVRFLK